jgi:hypothetical protein
MLAVGAWVPCAAHTTLQLVVMLCMLQNKEPQRHHLCCPVRAALTIRTLYCGF